MICSDGDLMEGVSYEAASLAGTNALGKLVYFYDDNHITIDGTTVDLVHRGPGARFEALGWHVQHVADVERPRRAARGDRSGAGARPTRPSMIIVRSHIAYGAPHAVDTAKAHGSPLGADEVAATKQALGWDPDKHFYVPDEVYAHMNGVERGNAARGRVATPSSRDWSQAFPAEREQWDAAWAGRIGDWTLPEFAAGRGARDARRRQAGDAGVQATRCRR